MSPNKAAAGNLWRWRGFVLETMRRELAARYAGAALGTLWHFIQPLAQILIFTFVFSEVMRARLPGTSDALAYGIYVCAGLLPWQLFAEIVSRGTSMFVDNAAFLKKSAFPRICLPLIVAGTAVVHFVVNIGVFLLVLALVGRFPGAAVLALVPLVLLLVLLASSLGLLAGTLNVFLRDVVHMVAVMLQFAFWLTPIVWALAIVPERFQPWLALNPLSGVMHGFQSVFLERQVPEPHLFVPAALVALVAAAAALVYFRHFSGELADEL